MGKAAIISSIVISVLTMTAINHTQSTTRRANQQHFEHQTARIAKSLAEKGQKLVLAQWVNSNGMTTNAPFSSLIKEGGSIEVIDFKVDSALVEFTVRGEYDGSVHDIHSRFKWNGFGINPLQIKAASVDFNVSPSAQLNFGRITLDDQATVELEEVLFTELEMEGTLADYGMGMSSITSEISEALNFYHSGIALNIIDQADRNELDKHNGIFFPDQVQQAIDSYLASHPGGEMVVTSSINTPSAFGADGQKVLRISDDLTLSTNLQGRGILIVEGDLVVPEMKSLDWQGIILVAPPAGELNPQIDFSGSVSIRGGLVALHQSLPNSGHMDVTNFRDSTGTWNSSFGTDMNQEQWPYWLYHTHDYTSIKGNSIRYMAASEADRIHEPYVFFHETLARLEGNTEVFLEFYHSDSHGRSILTMELDGNQAMAHPVAAGFHPSIAKSGNAYRTNPFKVNELKHLQIDIKRLSSLQKMWDDSEQPYSSCTLWDAVMGPICVAERDDRHHALALRLYKVDGPHEYRIYESTMYWHRREDEKELFAAEMEELINVLGSDDYGLDIFLGDSTSIILDPTAANLLGTMGGSPTYISNVITSASKWSPYDKDNPVTGGNPNYAETNNETEGGYTCEENLDCRAENTIIDTDNADPDTAY